MRILQILPELNVGGVERGTLDFARYLTSHNHYAVVVSHGGVLVKELEKEEIKHYTLSVHKKSFWSILKCIKALRRIIQEENIDIVHARSRVPAWIAFFACRGTKAAFITTCHGYYSNHFFSRVMGWAKLIIVPSEVIGRHMIDVFHALPENIRRIPRSVDLARFNITRLEHPGKLNYIVSIVGRLTPLKGHAYFLRAMARVVRKMPFVKIWIIGEAPVHKETYKQELILLVERLGLKDHVEFLGNRQDIPQLLAQTDVLVFSSVVPEAFGRVILEAQAVGVPVVATKVGGVIDIIEEEKTGLLVFPKDIEAMAAAIVRLLADKKFARQIVTQARKKLETEFTLENMASQTLKVYEELLDSLHILVIKMSSLGDVILVTSSLKALRKHYPHAKIYCLVGRESREVLQRCPYLDGIIVIDHKSQDGGLFQLIGFSKKLRKFHFDKIIDFQNNFKSHLLAALAFPRESYGFNNGKMGFLLSHPIKNIGTPLPPVEHQFKILERLGIEYHKDNLLELWPSERDKKKIEKLLEEEWLADNTQIVGINIAASEKWKTKNWPLSHLARLCDILAGRNIRVIITGVEKDRQTVLDLLSLTKTKPASFVGKTDIMELACLIKRCKVFITSDSAPMHIAAAMRVPFIAFFGPTASTRHLPPVKSCVVLERKPSCSPCYSPQCRIKTHICMRDILPEEVANHVVQLLT